MGLPPETSLTRRALLGGLGSMIALPARQANAQDVPRIAALDWVSGQNLLALGVEPLAMPELERYARLVVEPALPSGIHELGLRSEPNIELIDRLRPTLIVMSSELATVESHLGSIAPVHRFDPDNFDGHDNIERGAAVLHHLAQRIDVTPAFGRFIASLEQELAAGRQRLSGYDGRPVFLTTVIDARRLLVFGRNSLFQNVLDRLGIKNAWTGYTSRYGHATVNADRLAGQPDARLLCIGDSSWSALDALLAGPVLASLPFVRERRIVRIPDVLFYGGLPPARRFARLASMALAAGGRD